MSSTTTEWERDHPSSPSADKISWITGQVGQVGDLPNHNYTSDSGYSNCKKVKYLQAENVSHHTNVPKVFMVVSDKNIRLFQWPKFPQVPKSTSTHCKAELLIFNTLCRVIFFGIPKRLLVLQCIRSKIGWVTTLPQMPILKYSFFSQFNLTETDLCFYQNKKQREYYISSTAILQPPPVRNKYSSCWGRQMLRLIKVNRTM